MYAKTALITFSLLLLQPKIEYCGDDDDDESSSLLLMIFNRSVMAFMRYCITARNYGSLFHFMNVFSL